MTLLETLFSVYQRVVPRSKVGPVEDAQTLYRRSPRWKMRNPVLLTRKKRSATENDAQYTGIRHGLCR